MKNFSDQKYSNDKLLNVFVIAGTEDGRELAGFLIKSGFLVDKTPECKRFMLFSCCNN